MRRQREVSFYIGRLPTQTTKLCLWALQQDRSFYQEEKSALYADLAEAINLTVEQKKELLDHRKKSIRLTKELEESLQLIDNLKINIDKKHSVFDKECGRIESAASSLQIAKFLLWIHTNSEKIQKVLPRSLPDRSDSNEPPTLGKSSNSDRETKD